MGLAVGGQALKSTNSGRVGTHHAMGVLVTPEHPDGPSSWNLEDDCTESLNDRIADATRLRGVAANYVGFTLCKRDVDRYSVDLEPGMWMSFDMQIQGSGSGASDLDLFETSASGATYQKSVSKHRFERVAVYNDTKSAQSFHFAVSAHDDASSDYDLVVRTSVWDLGADCDDFYPTWSPHVQNGPCNRIMQFPRSFAGTDGVVVTEELHNKNLRREVAYLVSYAASVTARAYPNANPIGLLDMSEADGGMPGLAENDPRHPQGSHLNGNDIDIAYFQTGPTNYSAAICPDDGYYCTDTPTTLDPEVTAFFMAQLLTSSHVRVLGVDPEVATLVFAAADDLYDAGRITSLQLKRFDERVAYGPGWPFHQHHMHLSWDWEDAWY